VKEALRRAWVWTIPKVLGPMTRIPFLRAMSESSRCSAGPLGSSTSLKPEVMITAPLAPFSAHSVKAEGTRCEGTTMMARSILSGTSFREPYALIPTMCALLGLMG